MILVWLIVILLVGGLLAWLLAGLAPSAARWISLLAIVVDLALALTLWQPSAVDVSTTGVWIAEVSAAWIPRFGIGLHLGIDGLSLLMVLLTLFIGILSVACSWTEIDKRVGFFHFNLMWVLAGVVGVFLALDLFLLYFFWELMLVPMYFLIGIWGHERRIYAAIKFFIFTQFSGLLMLVAIIGLVWVHHGETGTLTFDYLGVPALDGGGRIPGSALLGTKSGGITGMLLMLGFFIAFAVKLPAVPFHTWLPDAHSQAPTAGSVILAALMLKTGAYGLIRFVVPLFPESAASFAPYAMTLGVLGILYGAVLAFAQTDLKRLIAYTSVSHLGFVMLGVFAWNRLALQGVVMQMICHGLSTAALFIIAGAVYERTHTRDLDRLGGLWTTVPKMGAMGLFFAMASLGLPGLGNFVAEILVLVGAYKVSIFLTVLATIGLVAATIYSLWLVHRTFHGPNKAEWSLPDINRREALVLWVLVIGLIWLGLYPQPVLDAAKPALDVLEPIMKR